MTYIGNSTGISSFEYHICQTPSTIASYKYLQHITGIFLGCICTELFGAIIYDIVYIILHVSDIKAIITLPVP